MSQILLLDSGPLGLLTQPRISEEVVAITRWLVGRLRAGDAVFVPAIVYALRLAADLWAQTRKSGRPTAPAPDLDVDVILAAQALTLKLASEVIVVTTNPRHLRPFVDARLWSEVKA